MGKEKNKQQNKENEGQNADGRSWIVRFWINNWGTILLSIFVLGYLAYQRVPLMIQDQKIKGKPAPEFTLNTLDGETVTLSRLKGKNVILFFWAPWCVHCKASIPTLNDALERYGDDLVILGITADDEPSVRAIQKKYNMKFPVLMDSAGKVNWLYSNSLYPGFVYIDREGNIDDIVHGRDWILGWTIPWKIKGNPFG